MNYKNNKTKQSDQPSEVQNMTGPQRQNRNWESFTIVEKNDVRVRINKSENSNGGHPVFSFSLEHFFLPEDGSERTSKFYRFRDIDDIIDALEDVRDILRRPDQHSR